FENGVPDIGDVGASFGSHGLCQLRYCHPFAAHCLLQHRPWRTRTFGVPSNRREARLYLQQSAAAAIDSYSANPDFRTISSTGLATKKSSKAKSARPV